MLDKIEALKVFCTAAETLQFKETAIRLAVSPPVITRMMAALEDELGEPLFQRNTRQIVLTDFGAQFLPQAQQLLEESERLFAAGRHRHADEMAGLVRITVPDLPDEHAVLRELLTALQTYPKLVLDWRRDTARLNVVQEQIDIGVRIGHLADSRLIARKIGETCEKIVMAPDLLRRLGKPKDFADLQKNYPLAAVLNHNNGRADTWYINENLQFTPPNRTLSAAISTTPCKPRWRAMLCRNSSIDGGAVFVERRIGGAVCRSAENPLAGVDLSPATGGYADAGEGGV